MSYLQDNPHGPQAYLGIPRDRLYRRYHLEGGPESSEVRDRLFPVKLQDMGWMRSIDL